MIGYIFFVLTIWIILIHGNEVHVDIGASCGSSCDGTSSSPFTTIQAGLDAAGSVLTIYDGTYTGEGNVNLTISNSYTTIQSANGAESTIIDCENEGHAMGYEFVSGTFTLNGLTVTNCNAI
eukprot:257104_1